MKKKLFLIPILFCIITLFTACEKRCHCIKYNGVHEYFTQEELDKNKMTCYGLENYQYGVIYSKCRWDATDY